jgi:4-hydroxybenzoate polyprenyltransferase
MFSVIKSYLDLCRVSNLATVWTNVLAAVVLSGAAFQWHPFILLLCSLSLLYSAGMCLNDIYDAKIDVDKKPFRPIPSGRISLRSASLFTGVLFAAGLLCLFFVPYQEAVWWGLLLFIFIVAYDKTHKKHPLSVLLMGACRLMIFVVSAMAVTGYFGPYAATAGFIQFFYVLVVSLVARYENTRQKPFVFPVIPAMIAAISILDGIVMAVFAAPLWLAAGIGGAAATYFAQRFIRGD